MRGRVGITYVSFTLNPTRQDVFDRDAEGGPRKLDEGEHGIYMTEAKRNRKIASG